MSGLQLVALALVLALTVVAVVTFGRGALSIARTVRRGGPAPDRVTEPGRRTWRTVREVLGHGRFRLRPGVRVAHWLVMVSFPVLFVTLVSGYAQIVDPRHTLALTTWPPMAWAIELLAWGSLLGIGWLITVRQRQHPRRGSAAAAPESAARRGPDGQLLGPEGARASRFFGSNAGQAYLVEAVVLVVVVAVLGLRALEFALSAGEQPSARLTLEAPTGFLADPAHFPLTGWLGRPLVDLPAATLEAAVVVLATVKIAVSMLWLIAVGRTPTMGVAWHRFTAVVNVWARRDPGGRPALGPAAPLRAADGTPLDLTTLDDLPDDLALGVGRVEDFTWKGLLDLASCTECGRCTEQCPAWNTGKPLSPKLVVTALRDHAFASTDAHAGTDVLALVGDVVTAEALWDCTTCGACVQACPVDIEHVDHILDLRRNQVLLAGTFPTELGKVFTALERRGNPWGLPGRRRLAWTEGLDFPVPVVGVDLPDASDLDCLFWVGCAGAYDERGQQVARAVAELLHVAGVRFAVLGDGETCTGDPARRAGNEALFQQLAHGAIDALDSAAARRVVTTCAHCFNTIAHEYPQLGGQYAVLHHTELLEKLVAEGRLVPLRPVDQTITYHDPCYLGRHNQVYAPPRALLGVTGATLTEMPRTGERSMCCGGGGARVWLEETAGRRIAADRVDEATGTGAGVLATACPFCSVMLTDAARGADQAPVVRDVAEVLLDAVRPQPPTA